MRICVEKFEVRDGEIVEFPDGWSPMDLLEAEYDHSLGFTRLRFLLVEDSSMEEVPKMSVDELQKMFAS